MLDILPVIKRKISCSGSVRLCRDERFFEHFDVADEQLIGNFIAVELCLLLKIERKYLFLSFFSTFLQ